MSNTSLHFSGFSVTNHFSRPFARSIAVSYNFMTFFSTFLPVSYSLSVSVTKGFLPFQVILLANHKTASCVSRRSPFQCCSKRPHILSIGLYLLWYGAVSYTHLRAHETRHDLVCRLLL